MVATILHNQYDKFNELLHGSEKKRKDRGKRNIVLIMYTLNQLLIYATFSRSKTGSIAFVLRCYNYATDYNAIRDSGGTGFLWETIFGVKTQGSLNN